ncbi:Zinc finger CCCH domain-containing protein 50 [Armadillidium vulgare]|nr:Zinc finger CCCH domain-containing protein 50 [Armadillidium vulgare]
MDNPANCSEKEIEQYSNKINVQNLSLNEISKNETINVQEDLEGKADGHLTVFDVEENIVRKEVILQQHIDNCNLKNSQTQSISNATSEVNVQCDVPKDEASILSNRNDVNSNQKIKEASINIEELCDFKIEKFSLKPSNIIETESFLEHASKNGNLNSHMKHKISVGEDSSKSIISNINNSKIVMHKTTVNPTVEVSSKIEIETDCDQKAGKSHKMTAKSTVEDLSKTEIEIESNPTVGKLKKMTAKSVEDHSSKSEIQPCEKNETSYEFKILKNENENETNKLVPYIFISDSEVEEEDSSNTNLEMGTKIENVIPRYDHIYIIGGFNPLFKENQNLLNFTFINKSISDLNEDNVIDFLEEKGCIVANSLCIFICDIIDIMKKYVETKSITSKSQGNDFIVYELKDSSSNTTEEGKLFISKSITSFIRIVDSLRNKLPVVVMPLQPYMLTVQFNFVMNESGADDSRLFVHGSSYKWTHYRDHFVKDWMRILDTNDKDINKTYIEPFVTKPPFVYPIRNAELKGIGIKRQILEWTTNVNEVILKLCFVFHIYHRKEYTTAGSSKDMFGEGEKCEIKITNLSESIPNKFFEEMSKEVGKEAICKFEEGYVDITFDCHLKGHLFANYLNNIAIGDTVLKTSFLHKDCKKGIPKLDETRRRNFRDSLRPLFESWEFSALETVKKNIRHTLNCESYKTIKCEKSECNDFSCIFYHSEMDRRRNPYSVPYGTVVCKYISTVGTCTNGDKCQFAHNYFESLFHPFEIYFKLCEDLEDCKTRKQCFSVNPLCARAHRDSPETFFTEFWSDSLLFGTPLAVEFLVGAISKFNLFNSAYKDTRIFMMGASMPFLDNVRKAVNQICGIHALNNDFVGERDLPFGTYKSHFNIE